MLFTPPQSVFDLLGCPHSMEKTGSVSAAVLPLGKSVAVGCRLSDPDPVWWQELAAGRHSAVGGSVLAVPPTCCQLVLCCSFPIQAEIPFLWEFPLSWQDMLMLALRSPPVTTCNPHMELSFSEPALGRWMVPRVPHPVSKTKPACPVGPFSQARGPPRLSWGCHCGVLALHVGCSGLIHVCTHISLVYEMRPPTTWDWLGINLKILPGLNWKKSRV